MISGLTSNTLVLRCSFGSHLPMEEVCQWTEARTFGMALSVAMKWMSPRVEALMVEKMRITNEEHGTMSIEWRVRNGEYEKRSMR
jgi:hypothetical protein